MVKRPSPKVVLPTRKGLVLFSVMVSEVLGHIFRVFRVFRR